MVVLLLALELGRLTTSRVPRCLPICGMFLSFQRNRRPLLRQLTGPKLPDVHTVIRPLACSAYPNRRGAWSTTQGRHNKDRRCMEAYFLIHDLHSVSFFLHTYLYATALGGWIFPLLSSAHGPRSGGLRAYPASSGMFCYYYRFQDLLGRLSARKDTR